MSSSTKAMGTNGFTPRDALPRLADAAPRAGSVVRLGREATAHRGPAVVTNSPPRIVSTRGSPAERNAVDLAPLHTSSCRDRGGSTQSLESRELSQCGPCKAREWFVDDRAGAEGTIPPYGFPCVRWQNSKNWIAALGVILRFEPSLLDDEAPK
jgi:hypothetical protein